MYRLQGPEEMTYMSSLEVLCKSLKQSSVEGGAEGKTVALVFGREDAGFVAGDLASSKIGRVCAIPMSRYAAPPVYDCVRVTFLAMTCMIGFMRCR